MAALRARRSVVQVAPRQPGRLRSLSDPGGQTPCWCPTCSTIAVDGAGNATLGWSQGATAETAVPYAAAWPRAQSAPSGAVSRARRRDGPPRRRQRQRSAAATGSTTYGALKRRPRRGAAAPLTTFPGAVNDLASESGAGVRPLPPARAGLSIAHRLPASAWTARGPLGGGLGAGGRRTGATRRSRSDGVAGAVQARTSTASHPRRCTHGTDVVLNEGKRIRAGWIGTDTFSPITYEVARQVATYRTPCRRRRPG